MVASIVTVFVWRQKSQQKILQKKDTFKEPTESM